MPDMHESDCIIFPYTRAQAIEDGVLVDVTEQVKETGMLLPTVITVGTERQVGTSLTWAGRTSACGEQAESGRGVC